MTNEELASLVAGYNPTASEDKLQEKINKLTLRTAEKVNKLRPVQDPKITGLYDADSPIWANPEGRKSTARLTGPGYYINAPELKVDNEFNPAGIAARIQADNFAMGVDAPNFPEGESLDPKFYQQYVEAINPAIAQRQAEGQYVINPLGQKGKYGRELVTAKSEELPLTQTDYLLSKGQGDKVFTDPTLKKVEGDKALEQLVQAQDKGGRFEEAIDLAQSEGLRLWADMSKAARSASRSLVSQFGVDPDSIGLKENTRLLGTDELVETIRKDSKVRDELVGFGSRPEWEKEQLKFSKAVEGGKYGEAAWNVVTNLDRYLAQSAPEMALLMTPYAGVPSVVGTRLNNQMEEFEANNGRPMTTQEAIGTAAAITAVIVPEKLLVKTGAKEVLGNLTKGAKGLKGSVVGVGASTAGEALQEGAEAIQEQYATQKEGERTLEEIATSPETIGGVIAGGVMGGALRGAGEATTSAVKVAPEVVKAGKKAVEKATETEDQRKVREYTEFSGPLKEEAQEAATIGTADTVVANAEQMHGKLATDLDESAPKSYTYGVIIRGALEKAHKSGDENAIKNVYKTMAELDAREDVDFKASEIVEEDMYELTQKFIKLINEDPETSASKLRELGKDIEESADAAKRAKGAEIMARVKALQESIAKEKEDMKSVMGSEQFEESSKRMEQLEKLTGDYVAGKGLDAVNEEVMELGFIEKDAAGGLKADPNKPGLKVYERELTKQMLDPKTNQNLLEKSVAMSGKVSISKLIEFAETRLSKLKSKKTEESYQTSEFIDILVKENEDMLNTINNLVKTAEKIGIPKDKKDLYKEELLRAVKAVKAANEVLKQRQKLIDSVEKKPGEGRLAYQVDPDGTESIQVVRGKNDKVKFADIVDGKVVQEKSETKQPAEPTEVTEVTKKWVQEQLDAGEDLETVRAKVDANSKLSPEYRSKVGAYLNTLTKPEEKPADVGVPVEQTKTTEKPVQKGSRPDKTANKEEYYEAAPKVKTTKEAKKEKTTDELMQEYIDKQLAKGKTHTEILEGVLKANLTDEVKDMYRAKLEPVASPLGDVRVRIAYVNEQLNDLIADVPDMDVKKHVKDHYKKKLEELQEDRTKLGKLVDRLEQALDKRTERVAGVKGPLAGIVASIDKLVKKMLQQLKRLRSRLSKANKKYRETEAQLNSILEAIEDIEAEAESTVLETTAGTIKTTKKSVYGVPTIEVDGETTAVKRELTKKGKLEAPGTAINKALEAVKKDKLEDLRTELKDLKAEGKTSLSAKLTGRLLSNYPMQNAVHRIIERTNDSVFGQMDKNMFAEPKKLLETLPKSFKDFFVTDAESRAELASNFETMDKYIQSTEIGTIKISDDARVYSKSTKKNHIDLNGLIMKNVVSEKDGKTYNFPVDIIELLGTTKDGVLELDEQTETILKFYSAKLLSDTQRMIGLILSMDESEMGLHLGITDPTEQLKVKQEARQGYVSSASVRKDIGNEVYQALGIRFNEKTPEFTSESFKAALGLLVQTIAIENGSMSTKAEKGTKNQNLIKTNWDNIGVERNDLIKSINKLQYMNENRSRPLPKTVEPTDKELGERTVMNTQNVMDKKSNDFLNNQEKTAYTISPRLQRWLDMDETEALKAMGYVEIDENTDLHVSEIDAQLARNDKLVREWDILKTFAKATKDKKFYLDWGQTVSGRYTILNDIQYQESKLHREFVVAEGSVEKADPKNADDVQMLEASIMQGLDMDPDKLSAETATKNFNKMFKVTDKGIEVTEEGPVKQAYEALRDGKVDAEATAEVFADSEGHHGISSIELLVDWDKAIKDGKKVETHANLEIDAITSGMILTLLQIGSDVALRLAEKGGIYTEARKPELEAYVKQWLGKDVEFTPGALIEAGKKHAAEIEEKMETATGKELADLRAELESDTVFKDLYSTIGVAMVGEVQAYKAKLESKAELNESETQQLAMLNQIGELNLKNIRSIAKSPVMVYIYGATINSIKTKLTYSLGVDTLVKAIKSASKKLKKGDSAAEEEAFIKLFIETEKHVDGFGVPVDKPAERWKQLLHLEIDDKVIKTIDGVINATFGTGIETAFENKLGFVDKNRDAAKSIEMLVFQAYQIRMAEEVNAMLDSKYGSGRHNGEPYRLSKEDLQDINNTLTDNGYGHNIVWYEDGETINQTLNKTGSKGGRHSMTTTVGNVAQGGQIKQSKPEVNTGAAPTISIHAIDGRMMLDVLNRELDGKYAGGNVYDAVVLGVNKAMLTDTADSYNTNMIETGFGRSILADQLTMLENMFYTKDALGNKQFDEITFNKVFNAIGLRPEGELSEDYTNEANRIGLSTGKMLEAIELAEETNKSRVTNSANGYYSGHLFQMGSGLAKIDASETRAKEFPAIDSIKKLLQNKLEADRKVTQKEFGGKLNPKTNYVFNLDDIANKKTQVESAANIAQIAEKEGGKLRVTDKLWGTLSSNDVVEVIGNYKVPEKASSQKWHFENIRRQILNSDAGIVSRADLSKEGRELVDGVWVKSKKAEVKEAAPKQEIDKMTANELTEEALKCAKG